MALWASGSISGEDEVQLPGTTGRALVGAKDLSYQDHTLRRLPVVSLSASNPPGPILLLRDFFDVAFFTPANAPISVVIFSWSISCDDGMWARDFRDFGRVAGSVTSSREDILELRWSLKLKTSR